KERLLLLFMCLLTFSTLYAQESITVTGRVTDASNGQPLIGAGVSVKGTSTGAQTNVEGNFTIPNVPANATLVVDYLGYDRQEVAVNGQTIMSILLGASAAALDEVVVIGYGTASRRDLTGSIATVKGGEVADRPSANP